MGELRLEQRMKKAQKCLSQGLLPLNQRNLPSAPLTKSPIKNKETIFLKKNKVWEVNKSETRYIIPGLEHLVVTKVPPEVVARPKSFAYRKEIPSAITAVSYEPYRYSAYNTMPVISHFRADPMFNDVVGKNKEVAVTEGYTALLTDLDGNVLLAYSMFEDGLTLRTRISGTFNAAMYCLPARYLARQKQNGALFASKK